MRKLLLTTAAMLLVFSIAKAQFVLEFNTSLSAGTEITLPLNGTINVTVDWGDGNSESYTSAGDKNHTYTSEGIYTVSIAGNLSHFGKWNIGYSNADKLVRVTSFGNVGLTSLNGAFYKASNLIEVPSQLPTTVTDIAQMFHGASSFNQDIGTWNVSNVTEMHGLFEGASSFNQDIGSWIVNGVTDMNSMFKNASSFNQNIDTWVLGNVTNMSNMFNNAISFNQDILTWDLSKLENTDSMFYNATAFNGDISTWNVFKVTSMRAMFAGATQFNQDISAWNVFKVTDMASMFEGATAFNQDIGGWDVKKVTNMNRMFYNASSFDQDISDWNIEKVTSMVDMFYGISLTTAFYNNMLVKWVTLDLNNNVTFHAGNSTYSAGAAADARNVLISTYQWTITDGGLTSNIVLSTNDVTGISMMTATSGGSITDDAGSAITARGVIWNTTGDPTISDNLGMTTDGTGIGSYTSNITGLTAGSTYYVRAYATNSSGTEYGNNVTFTAQQNLTLGGSFTAENKEYDGSKSATFNTNNLILMGVDGGHPNVSLGNIILSFDNVNAENNKTVTVLHAELTGSDAYKYNLSLTAAPTATATITPKELTVNNAMVSDKEYDGSTDAEITGATLAGIVSGDNVTLSSLNGIFDSKSAGTNKTVTSILTIEGADASNYSLTQPTGLTASITTKSLSVAGTTASNKIYDGTTDATISGSSLVGIVAGDAVTIDTETGSFATKNVGTNKEVTTTLTLNGADADNYNLIQPSGLTANITIRELTVINAKAINKVYDGTTSAIISGSSLSGVVAGDLVTINDTLGVFNTKTVGIDKNVSSAITIEGTDANNYLLIQPTGLKASITPKVLSVLNTSAANKVYDGTVDADISGATLEGVVTNDEVVINSSTGIFTDKHVGINKNVYVTISINGSDAANYGLTQPTGILASITAKPITVINSTASSKEYDGTTDAVITGSLLSGLVLDDDVQIETENGTFDTKNIGDNKTVTGTITITGADALNYALTQPTLTASITAKELTVVNAVASNKTYNKNTATPITGATLVGIIDGDNVFLGDTIGLFKDINVGVNKAVDASLTLNGSDALNYTLVQPTGLSADITPAILTVSNAYASNKVYDGTTSAAIKGATLIGVYSGDRVQFNSTTGALNDKNTGIAKPVTAALTLRGTDALNYTLVQPTGLTANITAKELTISNAKATSKEYDGTTIASITGENLKGVASGDYVMVDTIYATFNDKHVGNKKPVNVTATINGTDAGNYSLSQPTGLTANITAKPLTVINAVALSKVYDGTVNTSISNASLLGIVEGDSVTIDENKATFKNKRSGTDKKVTADITLTGADASEYSVVQPHGLVADITPAEITIDSILVHNKVYDGTDNAEITNVSIAGILIGDEVLINKTESYFNDKNVGTDKIVTTAITIIGDDAPNYAVTQLTDLTASITSKELIFENIVVSNRAYNGNTDATISSIDINGIVSRDDVYVEEAVATFNDKNVGIRKDVNAIITLGGEDVNNYSYSQPAGLFADITAAELTISGEFTVFDKMYDGNSYAAIDSNNLILRGVIEPDSIVLINPVAEFPQTAAGEYLLVSITSAEINGDESYNYFLSLDGSPTTRANITAYVSILNENDPDVTVYPNPFTNVINFKSNAEFDKVTLTGITGNKLFDQDINGDSTISTDNLRSGIYFLNFILKSGKVKTVKLFKD